MNNNCLITKLKRTVDNPSLPIFGGIKLHFINNTNVITNNSLVNQMFYGVYTEIIFSDGQNHFCTKEGVKVPPSEIGSDYIYLEPGDYYITIPVATHIHTWRMYSEAIANWENKEFYFDLNQFYSVSLSQIQFCTATYGVITGNIEKAFYSSKNIRDIANFPAGVTGNLDRLIRSWLLNGRTETIDITISYSSSAKDVTYYSDYNETESSINGSNISKITIKEDKTGYQIRTGNEYILYTAWKYQNGSWIHDDSINE